MRFTQKFIATIALLSICAYANPQPIGNQLEVSGGLLIREATSWCAGFSDEECAEHCQHALGDNAKHTCNPKYVNLKYS